MKQVKTGNVANALGSIATLQGVEEMQNASQAIESKGYVII